MSGTERAIFPLTDHEQEIMKMSLTMTDAKISYETGLAVQTIKNIRTLCYRKLGVMRRGSRAMLIEAAQTMGWIEVNT